MWPRARGGAAARPHQIGLTPVADLGEQTSELDRSLSSPPLSPNWPLAEHRPRPSPQSNVGPPRGGTRDTPPRRHDTRIGQLGSACQATGLSLERMGMRRLSRYPRARSHFEQCSLAEQRASSPSSPSSRLAHWALSFLSCDTCRSRKGSYLPPCGISEPNSLLLSSQVRLAGKSPADTPCAFRGANAPAPAEARVLAMRQIRPRKPQ